jgi:2-amino-4-hydroxy-6-hydroxymethyldihydropteridine diphosphokinase
MAIAHIGIGSNLGNREENCLRALVFLEEEGMVLRKRSALYETEPWGVKNQPGFINAAVEIETDKGPQALLDALKKIEKTMGRTETRRWGPRVIDLDILFYDDLVIDTPDLKIPHPHLHERDFVLWPLSDIAPDKLHPVLRKTVKELLAEVK